MSWAMDPLDGEPCNIPDRTRPDQTCSEVGEFWCTRPPAHPRRHMASIGDDSGGGRLARRPRAHRGRPRRGGPVTHTGTPHPPSTTRSLPTSATGRWRQGCPPRADRAAAEAAVRDVYRTAGIAEPRIVIWMDSPVGGMLAAETIRGQLPGPAPGPAGPGPAWGQLWDQLWGQLGASLGPALGQPGPALGAWDLGDQLRDQLWDQLRDQPRGQPWDQLSRLGPPPALGPAPGTSLGASSGASSGTSLGPARDQPLGPGDQPGASLGDQLGGQLWDQPGPARGQLREPARGPAWGPALGPARGQPGDQPPGTSAGASSGTSSGTSWGQPGTSLGPRGQLWDQPGTSSGTSPGPALGPGASPARASRGHSMDPWSEAYWLGLYTAGRAIAGEPPSRASMRSTRACSLTARLVVVAARGRRPHRPADRHRLGRPGPPAPPRRPGSGRGLGRYAPVRLARRPRPRVPGHRRRLGNRHHPAGAQHGDPAVRDRAHGVGPVHPRSRPHPGRQPRTGTLGTPATSRSCRRPRTDLRRRWMSGSAVQPTELRSVTVCVAASARTVPADIADPLHAAAWGDDLTPSRRDRRPAGVTRERTPKCAPGNPDRRARCRRA